MTLQSKPIRPSHRPLPELDSAAPEWLQLLHADVAITGSIAGTARRVGVDRSALSGLLNRTDSSPYVKGTSSTAGIEAKVNATLGLRECPFLSQEYGEPKKLSGLECRSYACVPTPPTQSPRAMQHWRACQTCKFKPHAAIAAPVIVKPAQKIALVTPVKYEMYGTAATQQAGIIDKVTLPLPEVGAPQIADQTNQEAA